MAKANKIPASTLSFTKIVSVIVMFLGLLFLTGANFFVYADHHFQKNICSASDSDQNEAPSPVEEKSKSYGGINIQEEYLHEKHSFKELAWLSTLLHHQMTDAEKLQIVHYDLVSPPPKA